MVRPVSENALGAAGRAAVVAGLDWVLLNRSADYLESLRAGVSPPGDLHRAPRSDGDWPHPGLSGARARESRRARPLHHRPRRHLVGGPAPRRPERDRRRQPIRSPTSTALDQRGGAPRRRELARDRRAPGSRSAPSSRRTTTWRWGRARRCATPSRAGRCRWRRCRSSAATARRASASAWCASSGWPAPSPCRRRRGRRSTGCTARAPARSARRPRSSCR